MKTCTRTKLRMKNKEMKEYEQVSCNVHGVQRALFVGSDALIVAQYIFNKRKRGFGTKLDQSMVD